MTEEKEKKSMRRGELTPSEIDIKNGNYDRWKYVD